MEKLYSLSKSLKDAGSLYLSYIVPSLFSFLCCFCQCHLVLFLSKLQMPSHLPCQNPAAFAHFLGMSSILVLHMRHINSSPMFPKAILIPTVYSYININIVILHIYYFFFKGTIFVQHKLICKFFVFDRDSYVFQGCLKVTLQQLSISLNFQAFDYHLQSTGITVVYHYAQPDGLLVLGIKLRTL